MKYEELAKKYVSERSNLYVLSALFKKPSLLKDIEYLITEDDFTYKFEHVLFNTIYNLSLKNINKIEPKDVESYLAETNKKAYEIVFDGADNEETFFDMIGLEEEVDFDLYYNRMKKMSLLRNYVKNGISVNDILDLEGFDTEKETHQRELLEDLTLEDIIRKVDNRILTVKETIENNLDTEYKNSKDICEDILNKLLERPSYGFNFESLYLNTIGFGLVRRQFILESRRSGTGKSRNAVKRMVGVSAKEVYNIEKKEWEVNPHPVGSLLIQTELEIDLEVVPMFLSFISGVSQKKIKTNKLTKEERERLAHATQVFRESDITMVTQPEYDTLFISNTIEKCKLKSDDLGLVILDYIELNGALSAEYSKSMGRVNIRPDLILLNLSKKLKDFARKFNICMVAYTQISDSNPNVPPECRDYHCIQNGKAIKNKADCGIVSTVPTRKELDKMESVISQIGIEPNLVYGIYKNRNNDLKECLVWVRQDLGSGEVVDLFVTNKEYKVLDVEKIKIEFEE